MSSPIDIDPTPSVTRAIETRRSVRAFRPDPVPEGVVREMLATASRSASGGNLQPWRVYVLAGDALGALIQKVTEKRVTTPFGDGPEYDIYPHDLSDPYKKRRSRVAHMMYELVGIGREDSAARIAQMSRNFCFFDAPIGMIISIDRQMGPPQFSDLGIFLQSLMLLARERGLHTCPQESWSMWGKTIREVVGVPEHELVFCGLALGYAEANDPINALHSERASVDEFAELRGF